MAWLTLRPGARVVLRDAGLMVAAGTLAGLGTNAVRADRIPFVQTTEYEILVPCPEPSGEVGTVSVHEALNAGEDTLLVDARPTSEYQAWHLPGAQSLVFDYLDPLPEAGVRAIARARVRRVIVYGDGDDPDTGHELSKLLASRGIRNVHYVPGGAPALRRAAGGRR